MTLSGWIFMSASWAAILGMFFYCMCRTLRKEDDGVMTADEQNERPTDL